MISLVDSLRNKGIIKSSRVEAAMKAVDRGNYALSNPYVDSPQLLTGFGVTISAPHMHAHALQLLADHLKEGMSCLDVGSGSGYLTACMALMVGRTGRVVGIDIVEQLTEFSKNNLRKDQPQLLQSIILVTGDGSVGYPPKAPYDAIHVGAAADGALTALHQQLKPGGRMIVPVGPQGGTQYLEQHDKREDGRVVVKRLMGVRYGSLVRKEVKPDQAQNGVRHAPLIGMSDRRAQEAEKRAQEAEKRAREAEGRARTAEREKEVAIGEKEAAKREKEAAEREKAVAIWEKEEAKREKEAAEMAKLVAIREKEEAKRGKEAAERGREVAETRRQECERMLEELEGEEKQQQQQVEAYWAVERREIQLTDQEIGRGAWATVSVAVFRGARVAAKCVHSQIISPHNIQLFKREMDMAARIRHPNLLLFIGATLQGEMVILTELMSTSLRRELEREYQLTPRLAIAIGLDVARALNYLHLMRPHPLIHRDISSANVLLESLPNGRWRAKVSDYGTVNLQRNLTTSNPGNPCYSAPEAYNPSQQSPKMDIFSFGALLTEMLAGELPVREERARLLRRIHHQPLLALIQRCLKERREDRPNASDIITELDP